MRPLPEISATEFSKSIFYRLESDGIPVKAVHHSKNPDWFPETYNFRVELFGVEGQVREPLQADLNLWDFQLVPYTTCKDFIKELEDQYKKVLNPIPI